MDSLYEGDPHQRLEELEVLETKPELKNANSLNEYLDNSEEEDNNYEAHLKFRKKALERELEADDNQDKICGKKGRDSPREEELFFLKLY